MRDEAADIPDRLEAACGHVLPSRSAARVLASELAVLYYALFAWRAGPHAPANAYAFRLHRESGIAMLFGFLAGVSLGEVLVVHLLVQRWSHMAAWIATAAVLVTEDALVLHLECCGVRACRSRRSSPSDARAARLVS